MICNLPVDIKAETLLSYLSRESRIVGVVGSHKRNAYEDISSVFLDDKGLLNLAVCRRGLYDILPETLFHPIDRFENIPANEYRTRIKEEIELQQIEEDNARKFFSGFDKFILELGGIISKIKEEYSDNNIIAEIISDSFAAEYSSNRFVKRTMPFLPLCRIIRGDKILLTQVLRFVLFEEDLRLIPTDERLVQSDEQPRYNITLESSGDDGDSCYLGNEFEENVITFNIKYWSDKECSDQFLEFIAEMEVYTNFIKDYFIGVENLIRFNISTNSLPVRLSDEISYNYLDYNTNI